MSCQGVETCSRMTSSSARGDGSFSNREFKPPNTLKAPNEKGLRGPARSHADRILLNSANGVAAGLHSLIGERSTTQSGKCGRRDSGGWGELFLDTEENRVLKRFRQSSVDFNRLGQVDIHYDCVHGVGVRRVLEHHPRITPVRNQHLPAHRPDIFLVLAELKTGQFKDSSFNRIHGGSSERMYELDSRIRGRSLPYIRRGQHPPAELVLTSPGCSRVKKKRCRSRRSGCTRRPLRQQGDGSRLSRMAMPKLRERESGNARTSEPNERAMVVTSSKQPRRQGALSLLVADVQPDHRPSGFADDTIAIAAPATFESSFGSEITRQESKQDCKNNQACDRKQHRIVKTHGRIVVSGHRLVKRQRQAARFFSQDALNKLGRGRPRPRVLCAGGRSTGTSRPRPCLLRFLNSHWVLPISKLRADLAQR